MNFNFVRHNDLALRDWSLDFCLYSTEVRKVPETLDLNSVDRCFERLETSIHILFLLRRIQILCHFVGLVKNYTVAI